MDNKEALDILFRYACLNCRSCNDENKHNCLLYRCYEKLEKDLKKIEHLKSVLKTYGITIQEDEEG